MELSWIVLHLVFRWSSYVKASCLEQHEVQQKSQASTVTIALPSDPSALPLSSQAMFQMPTFISGAVVESSTHIGVATPRPAAFSQRRLSPARTVTLVRRSDTIQSDDQSVPKFLHNGESLTYHELCAKLGSVNALAVVYASDSDSETE